MTYVQLPMLEVDVGDLLLDLANYRIPTRPDDEAAALNYLFAEEDVLGAAKLILRDGYFDNEVPIAVEEDGAYVVLEGNRRVSALKGLLDPNSVPSHAHDLRMLLKRYAVEAEDLPKAIRVLVAPSREAANPHIARLHTTVPKKRWSRDQQANYYYSLLGPGVAVDNIKADYPDVDVVRFIKMAEMRRFLSGVAYRDPSLRNYVTGPGLAMSAFEYAYRSADIAEAIGVSFNIDGHVRPTTKRPEAIAADLTDQQRAAIEYLMIEFRAKRLNTRSTEFKKATPEHAVLVAELAGNRDDARQDEASGSADQETTSEVANPDDRPNSGSPSGADAPDQGSTDTASDDERESGSADGRGPNHPDTKATLSLTGLDYTTHTSANLQRRYHELRKVNLKENPVAAALLLRSVLETTIKFHFEGTSTPAVGQLSETIKVVISAYGKTKSLQHSINRIQSGGTGVPGSAQWFNLASHSADLLVDTKQVHAAFGLLEPLLRHLLRPPASGPAS
ncbi:hypothetical protein [Ornithinimicrobium sediminis]|uniref:hypothetical protein n=1 Tax=Ornithinimicrobium sediminis TaxID=2904603 RepID=UPI001E526218|nr:hypothetical protein [Ornithinimicrobium sediminis]MCE0485866.1 hypothetical protein [Ornithinimicrobium sediminis]